MHFFAGTPEAEWIEKIYLNGREVQATEVNQEEGWLIRYATPEEIEKLVTGPGLVWPWGTDVLIQERGEIRIEWRGDGWGGEQ